MRALLQLAERWSLPPARLAPVPARLRPAARILWVLLALIAVATIAGGSWRGYVQTMEVDPRFNRLGLMSDYPAEGGYTLGWLNQRAKRAGVIDGSTLIAVDGRRAPAGISEEGASRMLDGPPGWVRVTLRAPDGTVSTSRLERSEAQAANDSPISNATFFAITTIAGAVSALVALAAAVLLARRRFDDPVSLALSTSLLLHIAGLPLGAWWWQWLDLFWLSDWATGGFLILFFIAVPAFPDGRYRPRWSGWLVVPAIPLVLLAVSDLVSGTISLAITIMYGLLVAMVPVLRFVRTPPGLERQQLKWAGAGFFGAMVTFGFSTIAIWLGEGDLLPTLAGSWVRILGFCLLQAAMMILPLGVLVSMLRYRLWDADAVIGRSAGWAILTLLAGAVWAGSTAMIEEIIESTMGEGNKGLAAAASTVFALLVLAPAHDRVVGWMDARFRANLLRLRALPERLQIWQHSDTPEDIGARVTDAMVDTLHTERAAMLLYVAGSYQVVGTRNVAPEAVAAWIAANSADGRLATAFVARGDPLFPLRMVLDDAGAPIGALLLGLRSDGSLYGRDERDALSGIENALAAALRQAQRRRVGDTRMAALLGQLEARLQGLERSRTA